MRCLDCRATIEDGSNFCRHCGASQYVEPPLPASHVPSQAPPASGVAPRSSLSSGSPVTGPRFRWDAVGLVVVIGFVALYFAVIMAKSFAPDFRADLSRDPVAAAPMNAESAKANAEALRALAEARAATDAMEAEMDRARADADAAIDRVEGMAAERDTRAVQ